MRALIVTNMWPSPEAPALGSFVRDQVDALRRIGGDELELEVFSFPPKGYARAARELRRLDRARPFDVVHAHFGLSAWPALAAPARARVVTLHGTDLRHPRTRALTRLVLPRFDLVATGQRGPRARAACARGSRPPRGAAVRGGDRSLRSDPARRRARPPGARADGRYLLFPSDPARPAKRHDRAAEVAAAVSAELLLLRGVAPADAPLWVNAAGAVVMPSEQEGFGLAVLEALACDVPVVAAPTGIHAEALTGIDGTLCAPYDRDEWSHFVSAQLDRATPGSPAAPEPGTTRRTRWPSASSARGGAWPPAHRPDGPRRVTPPDCRSWLTLHLHSRRGDRCRHLYGPQESHPPPACGRAARGARPRRTRCGRADSRLAELSDDVPAAESEAPATTADDAAAPVETSEPPQDSTVVMDAVSAPEPEPLPKGAYDPASVPQRPGFRERGRMRRRLRYLREVRELGFRDLGGLVFDQHRFGRPNETLVQGKVAAIDAIDRESRALSTALRERSDYTELFVAGVSACQRCGTLHPSDARYCPHCGLAFAGPRFLAGVGATDDQLRRAVGPRTGPAVRPALRAGAERRAGRRHADAARRARARRPVVSTPAQPGAPVPVVDYGARPCPRCGELIAGDQDWCLRCGDPARTVIAPTPRWRRPLWAIAALAASPSA